MSVGDGGEMCIGEGVYGNSEPVGREKEGKYIRRKRCMYVSENK